MKLIFVLFFVIVAVALAVEDTENKGGSTKEEHTRGLVSGNVNMGEDNEADFENQGDDNSQNNINKLCIPHKRGVVSGNVNMMGRNKGKFNNQGYSNIQTNDNTFC